MRLFSPDFYRNIAIGFILGALAVGAASTDEWDAQAANAQPVSQIITPSADFMIGAE